MEERLEGVAFRRFQKEWRRSGCCVGNWCERWWRTGNARKHTAHRAGAEAGSQDGAAVAGRLENLGGQANPVAKIEPLKMG
jgi:hypothetical protein